MTEKESSTRVAGKGLPLIAAGRAQEQARAAVVRFIPDSWDQEKVANFLWRLDDYARTIEAEARQAGPANAGDLPPAAPLDVERLARAMKEAHGRRISTTETYAEAIARRYNAIGGRK